MIDKLPIDYNGIAEIVQFLCTHLEQFGMDEQNLFSESNDHFIIKTMEKLKDSIDYTGIIESVSCSNVKAYVCLLKMWTSSLSQPLVPKIVSNKLSYFIKEIEKNYSNYIETETPGSLLIEEISNDSMIFYLCAHHQASKQDSTHSLMLPITSDSNTDENIIQQNTPEARVFAKILIGNKDRDNNNSRHKAQNVISILLHYFQNIFKRSFREKLFAPNNCSVVSESSYDEKCDSRIPINKDLKYSVTAMNSMENESNCYSAIIALTNEKPVIDTSRFLIISEENIGVLAQPPFISMQDDVQEEIRNIERFSPRLSSYHSHIRRRNKPLIQKRKIISHPSEVELSESITNYAATEKESTDKKRNQILDNDAIYQESMSMLDSDTRNFQFPNSLSVALTNNESSLFNSQLKDIDRKMSEIHGQLQCVKKGILDFRTNNVSGKTTALIENKILDLNFKDLALTNVTLKNRMKRLRKEADNSLSALRSQDNTSYYSHDDRKKMFAEAEKRILCRQIDTHRPCELGDMDIEELQDEKLSLKRELISFESQLGRSAAHSEEIFLPVYIRYQKINQLLAKSVLTKKIIETICSDLITIDENELMNLESIKVSPITTTKDCQLTCNVTRKDLCTSNIHELSSSELIIEYKATKNEKKKLRCKIFMYEQESENNLYEYDGKQCIHSLKYRYKNIKAKLKLLEALMNKRK